MSLVSVQLGDKNAAWFTTNATVVTLKKGQVVFLEGNSGTFKKGDGSTLLGSLPFLGGSGSGGVQTIGNTDGQLAIVNTDPANPKINLSNTFIIAFQSLAGLVNTKQNQLSGTGLVRVNGTNISYDNTSYLSAITSVAANSANFTAVTNTKHTVNTTTGNISAALPATNTTSDLIFIQKSDSSVNLVNITGTINGVAASTLPLRIQLQGKLFQGDGTGNWNIIAGDLSLTSLDSRYSGSVAAPTGQVLYGGLGTGTASSVNFQFTETVNAVQVNIANNGLLLGYSIIGNNSYVLGLGPEFQIYGSNGNAKITLGATGYATYNGTRHSFGSGGGGQGFVYIGDTTSTATAKLQIKEGTTVAGTGPLKMTVAGAALVNTPEIGLWEVDNANRAYYTGASGTRNTLAYLSDITGGGLTRSILINQTGSVSAASASNTDYVYVFTNTGTLTLPTAASNTNRYTAKNSSTTTSVTINFTSGQNADGSTSITIGPQQSLEFISNNTNYVIL